MASVLATTTRERELVVEGKGESEVLVVSTAVDVVGVYPCMCRAKGVLLLQKDPIGSVFLSTGVA